MALPSPLPVALFFSQFLTGGTERQMIELAKRLDRRRFDVHIACLHRRGPWLGRATEVTPDIAEFPIRSFKDPATLGAMRRFAAWCREKRIAVLHATDLYSNVFALPAAAAARVPVRVGNRREINPDKGYGQVALQRLSYAFAHRVVANSNAAASRLRQEGVADRDIVVIPNGVEVDTPPRRRPTGPLRRIVTVACLRPEKAHEVLIEAAVPLLAEYPEAELHFAGDGPRLEALRQLAERRGIAARVRFLGHREDVPSVLADSDIFTLVSRSEAFPNGVIEGMAAGLPIVATRVGGIPELIADGRNGLLVPVDDPAAVTAAWRELIAHPERAAELGRAARQTVEARFSFDRMVSSFEALYLELLGRRAPRAEPATQPLAS